MRERDVFTAAAAIADPAERAAYLDGACAGDAALRGRVELTPSSRARRPRTW